MHQQNMIFLSSLLLLIISVIRVRSAPQVNPIPPAFPRPGLPPPSPPPGAFVPILQQNFDINPDGSYTFGYQSADGSARQETGSVKYSNVPGVEPALSVQGSYAYVLPDGQQVEVQYIADENGFQPSGPGIHPAILKAVAYQVAQARGQPPPPPAPNPNYAFPPAPIPVTPFPNPFSPTPTARSN